jgi:putative membrane protein
MTMENTLTNLTSSFLAAVIFALLGVVLFLVAFIVFDKMTPGSVWKELLEDQNVALGNLLAGIAIALAIIIAAAIH